MYGNSICLHFPDAHNAVSLKLRIKFAEIADIIRVLRLLKKKSEFLFFNGFEKARGVFAFLVFILFLIMQL